VPGRHYPRQRFRREFPPSRLRLGHTLSRGLALTIERRLQLPPRRADFSSYPLSTAPLAPARLLVRRGITIPKSQSFGAGIMMMRIFHSICVLAVLATAFAYGVGGANAQGSDAERQACTPDAMRLCADAIPDVVKVTACMKAKYSQLSEPCRAAMSAGKKKGGARRHHYYKHYYRHHCRHCG
jgi:hypothetical protein